MYILLSSGARLYEYAIIMFPDNTDRYILRYGWYQLDATNVFGWYCTNLSDQSVTAATADSLESATIIENGDPITVVAPTGLPEPHRTMQISVYQPMTKYDVGQIVYHEFGKLYHVCTTYVSNTIDSDVQNKYLVQISFGADAPYTNSVAPSIQTVGDALDYIINHISD